MLQRGAFEGVHAAMMVHPMSSDDLDHMPCLAIQDFEVRYHGKTAHASAYPELGLNAADALTVAQTAIGLLRQHIKHTDRIHGIVLHGGDAPNVVPHETSGRWYVRAKNLKQLAELEPRVERCFEAGALATGCTVDVEKAGPPYSEFEHDKGLAALYRSNAESLGRKFVDLPEEVAQRFAGSTDMANISLAHAEHPPNARPRLLPGVEPPARVHCRVHHVEGRPSGGRRCPCDGLDGHRRGDGLGDEGAAAGGSAGMSADAAAIDPDKLKAYSFLLFSKLEGAMTSGMVHLGDQLGLYRALAAASEAGWTSQQLADATGLDERWVREWAHNQAAAKLLSWSSDADGIERFSMTPEAVAVLADPDHPGVRDGDVPPAPADDADARAPSPRASAPASATTTTRHGPEGAVGHRAQLRALEPQLPRAGRAARARRRRRRARAGSERRSTSAAVPAARVLMMAAAFPKSTFDGYDISQYALARAESSRASRQGLTNAGVPRPRGVTRSRATGRSTSSRRSTASTT